VKALLQRVSEASVSLDGEVLSAIGPGLVVLVCTDKEDTEADADFFARKIANMRLFADSDGKSNLSVLDVGGEALVISQFTLAAIWRKGNRPGFSAAAEPEMADNISAGNWPPRGCRCGPGNSAPQWRSAWSTTGQ